MEDWRIIERHALDNGNVVTLAYDSDPWESPREWSNLGTIIHWHPRYDLVESPYSAMIFSRVTPINPTKEVSQPP